MDKKRWTDEKIKEYNNTHRIGVWKPHSNQWKNTDRHCPKCGLNCPCSSRHPDKHYKDKPALMDWNRDRMFHENVCMATLTKEQIEENLRMYDHNDKHYWEERGLAVKEGIDKITSEEIIERIEAKKIRWYTWDEFYDERSVFMKEKYSQQTAQNLTMDPTDNDIAAVVDPTEPQRVAVIDKADYVMVRQQDLVGILGVISRMQQDLKNIEWWLVENGLESAFKKQDKENEKLK